MLKELLLTASLINNANVVSTLESLAYIDNENLAMYANDPEYLQGNQDYLDDISLPQALYFTNGKSSINVGILDKNIETSFTEFNGRINNNLSQTFGEVETTSSHGTYLASIIGARTNNYTGIAGVDWNSYLVKYRYETFYNFRQCLESATSNGVKIVCCSTNFGVSDSNISNGIYNYNGLFVNSAGNQNVAIGYNCPYPYPAIWDYDNMIVVGGLNNQNQKYSASNFGNYVDIYAPAVDIEAYDNNGDLVTISGTSYAAAIVAGVASLTLSINPSMSYSQLKTCLLESADNITILYNSSYHSVKKINAEEAIKYAMSSYLSPSPLNTTITDTISGNTFHGLHKFSFSGSGTHEVRVFSNYGQSVACDIFDNSFNRVNYQNYSDSSTEIKTYLSEGTYYVLPRFASTGSSGYVNVKARNI